MKRDLDHRITRGGPAVAHQRRERRLRRRVASARHAVVRHLPAGLRVALRAPPWVRHFAVEVPQCGSVRLPSPDAHALLRDLYWEGPISYEPASVATWWCLSRQARAIVDVGAHVGYYTVLANAANRNAVVHAIEPFADAAELLRQTVRLNGCGTAVRVHEGPVSGRLNVMPNPQDPDAGPT